LIGAIIFLNANLPISHIDDFYFFGVAENLLKVGELENPYFTEEYFEGLKSKKFYFQPPFYPWLIAIWMGAFGINSISIPLFSFFITSIGALSVWVIGRFFSVQ
jgi:4-amino-4-deoxy-L-arabinose transferase-like glycosyltransferase